ncbi:zinc-binding dehydrogenase [Nocardioides carbamazepini]|uniref:zinc-binding dehydrogenase n=1 Tax=Nocardioides carbamazepini TaxID=2854259 RepID=UPI00214A8760|nr:zinc-binding dehydrogenase [Nocardioides carbamazepini]MCR1781270.1 zinc-binding dehydrogenase [Nocardioides carbamazepini]
MTGTTLPTTTPAPGQNVRAAVVDRVAANQFTLSEIRLSDLRPGEVLVDVKASGLCHSDWNFVSEDRGTPFPALLGHELAGVVKAVADGVTEFAIGDHVVGCGVGSCGECDNCREGRSIWCRHPERAARAAGEPPRMTTADGDPLWQFLGIGSFAEQTIVHQSMLVAVDPRVPFDRAAVLGCAVATGAGVVMRCAEVRPRETVVVFGAGGVGLNAIQAAALVGARKIIAVDVQDEKLELAKKFGATHGVNARDVDPVEAVAEITGGHGVDHVFEMTGLPGPLGQGYRMLGRDGTVYIVGMQAPGSRFELPSAEILRGASVRAVWMGSSNFKVDVPYYAELYLQGRFNLDDLVAQNIALDDINDGYARMLTGGGVARSVIAHH